MDALRAKEKAPPVVAPDVADPIGSKPDASGGQV